MIAGAGITSGTGATWSTQDLCAGTRTLVGKGRVNVTDTAPTLTSINNQTMTHTQGHITVTLPGADSNGDPLTYTAQALASSQASALQQQYGLMNPGNNYYFNQRGQNEEYLQGANGQWFFLLPTGGCPWRLSHAWSAPAMPLGLRHFSLAKQRTFIKGHGSQVYVLPVVAADGGVGGMEVAVATAATAVGED